MNNKFYGKFWEDAHNLLIKIIEFRLFKKKKKPDLSCPAGYRSERIKGIKGEWYILYPLKNDNKDSSKEES